MVNQVKVKMGKASRAAGKKFELKVRHDLESKGWIVCKWQNNVEFDGKVVGGPVIIKNTDKTVYDCSNPLRVEKIGKLIPAKHTFNWFTKAMSAGNGFPDFICFKYREGSSMEMQTDLFDVQLVESKMTGKLDKTEKSKIEWIKQNLKIPCLVASKNGKEIKYETI